MATNENASATPAAARLPPDLEQTSVRTCRVDRERCEHARQERAHQSTHHVDTHRVEGIVVAEP